MSLQGYNGWGKSLTGERNANFTILNLDTLNGNTINTSILNVSTLTSGVNASYINGYFSILSCSTLNVSNGLVDNVSGTSCSYINSSFTNSTIVNLSGTNSTLSNISNVLFTSDTASITNSTLLNVSGTTCSYVNSSFTNSTIVNLSGTNSTLSNISNVLFTSNTASITNSTLLNVSGTTCSYVNSSFTNSTITNCSALGITGTTCSYINISSTRISVINGSYERITSKYVNLSNCSLINASGTLLAFTNCFLTNVSNNLLTSDTASITNSTLLNVSGTTCSYVNSSFTNSTIVNSTLTNISNVLFTSDTASITNSTILSLSGTSCSYINSSFTNSTIVNLSNTGISSLYGDITTINTSVITGYNNKLILGYNSNLNVEISTEPLNDKTYIDFHSYNGSQNDYDARIYVSEPSFTTGQGKINLLGYTTNILSNDSGGFNVVLNNTSVLSCSVGKVYIPNLSNTNFSSDNSKITNVSGTNITATDVYFHNNILTNVSNTSLTSSKIDVTFVSSSYNTTVNTSNTSTTSAQINVNYLTGTTSSFTNSSFTRTTIINNSMTRITAATVSFTNATILNTSGTSCSYVNTSSTNFNAITGEILNFNTSTVTCTSDHLALCLNSGKYLEIGTDSANLQYIDFHCLDNPAVPTDYDYRMICSNGSTTLGKGTMKLQGKQTYIEMDTGGDIYLSVGGTTYQAINAGGGNQFPQGVNLGNNINLTWYPNIYSYSTNGNALIHNCNVAGGVIKEQIQGSDIIQIDTNYVTVNKPISIGYSVAPPVSSNIGYTVVQAAPGTVNLPSASWVRIMSYTLPSGGTWLCNAYFDCSSAGNPTQTTAWLQFSIATQAAPISQCGNGWGINTFLGALNWTPGPNGFFEVSCISSTAAAQTMYLNAYCPNTLTFPWYCTSATKLVAVRIG